MKKVWLAVLLNALIPGIGHMYVGKFVAGFGLLIGVPVLFAIFPIGAIILWLGSVIVVGIDTAIDNSKLQPKVEKKKKELDEAHTPFSQMDKQTKWTYIIGIIIGILVCIGLLVLYIIKNL